MIFGVYVSPRTIRGVSGGSRIGRLPRVQESGTSQLETCTDRKSLLNSLNLKITVKLPPKREHLFPGTRGK